MMMIYWNYSKKIKISVKLYNKNLFFNMLRDFKMGLKTNPNRNKKTLKMI